jgi:hypothetical protein
MEFLSFKSFQIVGIRSDLNLLRKALGKRPEAQNKCGSVEIHNPVSISLRRDLEEHEAVLRCSDRKPPVVREDA